MASLNKVILIGRLTHDPELRYTPNGQPVANFSLAVDRKFSKADETDFIPVVVWRRLAEICHEYLHKGKLVAIEGRLQVRSYEDKDGRRQRAFEVVADEMQMLDRPAAGAAVGGSRGEGRQESGPRTGSVGSSRAGSARPASAYTASEPPDMGYDIGGGFPPSDDGIGMDDIPF